jgi:hypothetical protein
LIANDEELAKIKDLSEEGEHALDPPSDIDGFWRKKLEILSDPVPALNLKRSFQNVARLFRLSKKSPDPWTKEMLQSSATMFALTHGGEMISGFVMGTHELMQHNYGAALGFYGAMIPGLYDVGCWLGQLSLTVRPFRIGFNATRKMVVFAAGAAAKKVGLPTLLAAAFSKQEARDRLLKALQDHKSEVVDVDITDADVVKFTLNNKAGVPAVQFHFQKEDGEMLLRSATFDPKTLADTPYRDIKPMLKKMGWNVKGALTQIRFLLRRNRLDLVKKEKTFVDNVEQDPVTKLATVTFRENAVAVVPKYSLRNPVAMWRQLRGQPAPKCDTDFAALAASVPLVHS